MTLVESLKKFLAKLGGNPNDLENNATSADVIDAISEAYTDKEGTHTEVNPIVTSGTKIATITTNNTSHDIYAPEAESGLPPIVSRDQGKFLRVFNNRWETSNIIEDFDIRIESGGYVVFYDNQTLDDVITAIYNGKIPRLRNRIQDGSGGGGNDTLNYFYLLRFIDGRGPKAVYFSAPDFQDWGPDFEDISEYFSYGIVRFQQDELHPDTSAIIEGKVLYYNLNVMSTYPTP